MKRSIYLMIGLLGVGCSSPVDDCVNPVAPTTTLAPDKTSFNQMEIDTKYTEQELEIIRDSLREWVNATGSESAIIYATENVVIGDGVFTEDDQRNDFGIATMQKVSKDDPGYQSLQDQFGPNVAGAGKKGRLVITITEMFYDSDNSDSPFMSDLKTETFHVVVLHELGHFLGLSHGDGILMRPSTKDVPDCIDQETRDSFCRIHENCVGG